MKYKVYRKEYDNSNRLIGTVSLDKEYDSYEEADKAVCLDVSYFRDHHDNDERIDWNVVEVYDDIGNIKRFEWKIIQRNSKNTHENYGIPL